MRPRDSNRAIQLHTDLQTYEARARELPGIVAAAARDTFVEQLLESIHRIEYVRRLRDRPISPSRKDASSEYYDPLKAAILFEQAGTFDEACWQVFLSVHFGKHVRGGWRLPRDVYGRLGDGGVWGWAEVTADVAGFKRWLDGNLSRLRRGDAVRLFSNHRKYLSLKAYSPNGTGAAVETYVEWVQSAGGHRELFEAAQVEAEFDSRIAFAILYRRMDAVRSFGRVGKFDYLTMLGKLGLANIEPNSAYIKGSTGPIQGARLLFDEANELVLDRLVLELGDQLQVNMQVMEDALCNWQKSPSKFERFRG